MFGQQDNQVNDDQAAATAQIPDQSIDGVLSADSQPTTAPWQHPGLPLSDGSTPAPTLTPVAASFPSSAPASVTSPTTDAPAVLGVPTELIDIKQQALNQLSPLVGHLEQGPEERFRTTMMLIQASDNQDLIKDAYAAAQAIPDEKTRAQALLDVVNEINYFTAQQPPQDA